MLTLAQLSEHCRTMGSTEQDPPTRALWEQLANEIRDYLDVPEEIGLPGL